MRNQIRFSQPPKDLFLNPGQDRGLKLLSPAPYFWREAEPALIRGFAASAFPEMTAKINSYLAVVDRHKRFSKAVEFNTVPVLLENASFRKSYLLAEGKCVLSGASGIRLLNRYCWENEEDEVDPEERLVDYFSACQQQNRTASIPLFQGSSLDSVAVAIECRNTFNYFHFMTESLSQLAVLADIGFGGNVYFHFPNDLKKTRPFVQGFVSALFPELEGRVFYERSPKEYERVLTAFEFFHPFYQFPAETVGSLDSYAPSDAMWRGQMAYRSSQTVLSANSFPTGLRRLRERALRMLKGQDFSHLPKRFFVGRDDRQSRNRSMAGVDTLLEMLQLFGFDYVVFENLTPLEQVAIMARAEVMISHHGAGFTNMIFANPDAYVLELGTLQTAIHRWGDFWPLAHVAGCRYISFFADHNTSDPLEMPSFDSDGIVPVALSDQGIAEIMAFVVTILGKLPDLPSAKAAQSLVEKLISVRDYARASAMLERHAHFIKGNLSLCLAKADCHYHHDEPRSELLALSMAYEADTERWQTLIRLIWCARRCGDADFMRWALDRLRSDFPTRYSVFVKNKPWMRELT